MVCESEQRNSDCDSWSPGCVHDVIDSYRWLQRQDHILLVRCGLRPWCEWKLVCGLGDRCGDRNLYCDDEQFDANGNVPHHYGSACGQHRKNRDCIAYGAINCDEPKYR